MHGVHEDLHVRVAGLEFLDQVHAAAILQSDVEDHNVRFEFTDLLEGGVGVFGTADDLHVLLRINEFLKPFDNDGVIVQYIDFTFHGSPKSLVLSGLSTFLP